MPPAGSSEGSSKLPMETPGRPLNALNDTALESEIFSKTVPNAVRRSFSVDIIHSKSGSCSKAVVNDVNLFKLNMQIGQGTLSVLSIIEDREFCDWAVIGNTFIRRDANWRYEINVTETSKTYLAREVAVRFFDRSKRHYRVQHSYGLAYCTSICKLTSMARQTLSVRQEVQRW